MARAERRGIAEKTRGRPTDGLSDAEASGRLSEHEAQRAQGDRHQEPRAHPVGAVHRGHGPHPHRCSGGLRLHRQDGGDGRHPGHRGDVRHARLCPGVPGRACHRVAQEARGAAREGPQERRPARDVGPGAGARGCPLPGGGQHRPGRHPPRRCRQPAHPGVRTDRRVRTSRKDHRRDSRGRPPAG